MPAVCRQENLVVEDMNGTGCVIDVTKIWPKETFKVKNLESHFLLEKSNNEMIRQVRFSGTGTVYLLKLSMMLTSGPTQSVRPLECSAPGRMLYLCSSSIFSGYLYHQTAWHCRGIFRLDQKLSAIHNFCWGNKRVNLFSRNEHCLVPGYFLLQPAVVPAIRKLNPNMQAMTKILLSHWPCWCYSAFMSPWEKEEIG